jgi:hypothetical protein
MELKREFPTVNVQRLFMQGINVALGVKEFARDEYLICPIDNFDVRISVHFISPVSGLV